MATTVGALGTKGNPFIKDPNAVLDYSEDWTDWLDETGDVIVDVELIFADGSSLEMDRVSQNDGSIVTAWLKGGTLDATETCTMRVTTAPGARIDDRTLYFKIKNK